MRSKFSFALSVGCLTFLCAIIMLGSAKSVDTKKADDETFYEPQLLQTAMLNDAPLRSKEYVSLDEPSMVYEVEDEPEVTYSEEDLDLLARLITAEAGCTWIPDDVQLYVGSVVLNRMNSNLFPDTLYDVIYQEGQYSPTWNGSINNTPDERTVENAKKLLEEGSVLPDNVVFQANFVQGDGIYFSYYDTNLDTTMYFCYVIS